MLNGLWQSRMTYLALVKIIWHILYSIGGSNNTEALD